MKSLVISVCNLLEKCNRCNDEIEASYVLIETMRTGIINYLFSERTHLLSYCEFSRAQEYYIQFGDRSPLRISPTTFPPTHVTSLLLMRTTVDVMEKYKMDSRQIDVLDMGCGCGNISILVARLNPLSRITAVDIHEQALDDTNFNISRLGLGSQI